MSGTTIDTTVTCGASDVFITEASHPYRIDGNGVTNCTGCEAFVLAEPVGDTEWMRIRPHRRLAKATIR